MKQSLVIAVVIRWSRGINGEFEGCQMSDELRRKNYCTVADIKFYGKARKTVLLPTELKTSNQ